ncbi:unnamed protein product, partial [Mesorhabditis belari]|uniref:Uncharacterized protein n=1 Tax=Mesorhabditis belari TaxID=2138241 RepID=A0AAF3FJU3_9BILA
MATELDRVMQDLALEREKCQRLLMENIQLKQQLDVLKKDKTEVVEPETDIQIQLIEKDSLIHRLREGIQNLGFTQGSKELNSNSPEVVIPRRIEVEDNCDNGMRNLEMPATGDYHYLSWPIQQPAVNVPFFDIHAYKHVNLDVPPSKNPQGQDLPLNDVSTLRFFFNLGVQQSRVVLLKQHLNQHLSSTSQGSNSAPPAPMVGPGGSSLPNQPTAVQPPSQSQPPQLINHIGIQLPQVSAAQIPVSVGDQLESLAQLSPQHHILRQQQNIFAQAQAQAAHQLQLNAARQQPVPQIDPVTSHSLVQQLEQLRVQSSNVPKPGGLEALLLQQALAAAQNNRINASIDRNQSNEIDSCSSSPTERLRNATEEE